MFSETINFESCCQSDEIVEFLYSIFKNDFIDTSCHLANTIYIDPIAKDKRNEKEKIFWHIITKDNAKSEKRELDKNRASRIKWIKKMILNHNHHKIKLFYHYENRQKVVRLYLWAYDENFIVIIQKLGKSSSHLVTSFYIDKHYNKNIYETRYQNYLSKKDINLEKCEWF
ncbi:MAG: hypothetical protein WA080_04205 [Sulfuricurvum sp.]|jgi:hypothetical protein|nr:MAG: hypothetical protein KU29_13385 [Sulfurovum sp. FS06-10]